MSSSILVDRVKIIALSSGTGPFAAGAAVPGYRGVEALIDGATYSYAVSQNAAFEVGQLVWNLSTGQFLRTPQISSSGNAAVPFAAGAEINFTARAADLIAIGGSFPIVNALGNDPNVAIAQQAASAAINGKADQAALDAFSGFLNSNAGASNVGMSTGAKVETELSLRMPLIASRTALAAAPVTFPSAFLYEAGREGIFTLATGSPPLTDTLQGLYVISNTPGYYWARVWDGAWGEAEWFGAIANSSGTDNVAAIQACLTVCGACRLKAGDYYTASTVAIAGYQQKLVGQGMHQNSGKGTRIVCTSATADVIRIGPAAPTYDGSGNISFGALVYNQRLADVEVTRSVQPSTDVVQANGDVGAVGVRVQFTLSALVERAKSQDSIYSWVWEGNINLYLIDAQATRGLAGTGTNPDLAVGYKPITGSGTPITASIAGTVMTVTGVASGSFGPLAVGMTVFLNGVLQGSIVSFGTGTGGNGTYNMSVSRSVSSQLLMAAPAGYTIAPTPPLTNINGNASCRLIRCLASLGITANSYGLRLSRFFTDHSIERFETAACSTGIEISGDAAAIDATNNASIRRNSNLEIIAPWIDQFGVQGIRIDAVDKFGMIRIDSAYFGPSAAATACMYITSTTGAVELSGSCEMAMAATNGGSCRGVLAIDSRNISISEGWNVVEGSFRAYEFNNCKGVTHRGMSTNYTNTTGAACYLLNNAETSYYAPSIRGVAGAVAVGVQFVGNIGLKSTVDISRIDWGCLAGANDPAKKANVLQYNGGAVTVGATTSTAFGNGCLGMGNPQ